MRLFGAHEMGRNEGMTPGQQTILANFQGPLSTAVLQLQVLDDILSLAPDYPASLVARLSAAIDVASDRMGRRDDLDKDEADDPASVPFERLDGSNEQRDAWELSELWHSLRLAESLGPHSLEHAILASQVVAICSALESLANDLAVPAWDRGERIPLFNRLIAALARDSALEPTTADRKCLRDLIETRNRIAHDRGRRAGLPTTKRRDAIAPRSGQVHLDQPKVIAWLKFADEIGARMISAAT